jgi:hypothetical protein
VVQFVAECADLFDALPGEIVGGLLFTVGLPGFWGSVPGRFSWRRGVRQIDGDGACAGGALAFGEGRGELQKPLSPHEIGVKGRAERIAPPGGSFYFPSSFSQQGVVHEGHQRSLGIQVLFHRLPGHPKERGRIESLVLKHPKIG